MPQEQSQTSVQPIIIIRRYHFPAGDGGNFRCNPDGARHPQPK